MSTVKIIPKCLSGSVLPPPSKSDAHRAIICAALSKGKSIISPISLSDDMKATINAVKSLGAAVVFENNSLYIDGTNTFSNIKPNIDCLESGSTLRFMIPAAAVSGEKIMFSGSGRLPERPIGPYLECLPKAGVSLETAGGLPLFVSGKLKSGRFSLPGNVSSQFITGLLLALPLLSGDSKIILTTPLESKGYVDLTLSTMKRFGVETEETADGYFIKGSQNYKSCNYKTEGDWSQAAFFLAAGALSKQKTVQCRGLLKTSKQGDKKIAEILSKFGAKITFGETVNAERQSLHGINVDASQIPDLVPAIAAVASLSDGKTVISGAERLRLKESDRLKTTRISLSSLGADIEETADGLIINGKSELSGGETDGFNDHRIVMALSVAAIGCRNAVIISGCECINKSYPDFFKDYNLLGGCADVINDR